ncbi:MAG: SDR family oxidoreductase [Firmicutes bacterium]|nr:SDR family oxidoreductase [Bacillota bacterium]
MPINMLDLTGKTAVVTGAARGIGRSVCLALGEARANVCPADLSEREVALVAEEVGGRCGVGAVPLEMDVSSVGSVTRGLEKAAGLTGSIDMLVNSAGVISTVPFPDLDEAEWNRVLSINLTGVFHCCRLVLPYMRRSGSGAIVNIASLAGKMGGGGFGTAAYATSKGGVITLTRSLAREAARWGIRVNAVAPGMVETDMVKSFGGKARVIEQTPLGRLGHPDEIAAAVLFLASPMSSYITGEVLNVDGGIRMD